MTVSSEQAALCPRCGLVPYHANTSPAISTVHCSQCFELIGLMLVVKGITPPGRRLEQRQQPAPAVLP